jgi:hypothetical protein
VEVEFYLRNKENLTMHNELLFALKIGVKLGKISSLICENVKNIYLEN